jgi:quinol monooxygenase YgiN
MYAFHLEVPQPIEMYDKVVAALQEAGLAQPPERLLHLCTPTEGGFRVTEVWESHEAVDRYGQEVMRPTIARVAGPEAIEGGPPPNLEFEVRGLQLGAKRLVP